MATEAQNRATAKYKKKSYDTVTLLVPKGEREEIRSAAEKAGMSLNAYIKSAIYDKMEKK